MPFFDLHCHPSFKSALLNDDLSLCPSPIEAVDIQLRVPFPVCVENLAGNSLDSQSSFSQIPGGSLVVAGFLAFERVYAFVPDLKKVKNLGTKVLQNMANETESYHQLMTGRDLAHFQKFLPTPSGLRQYKLLSSITEYPSPPDPNTIYVVASIEGIHNFYSRKKLLDQEKPANQQEIVDQLELWKQQSAVDPATFPRLLHITLAHHGQNALTNHAWAIPIRFATDTVSVGSFNPTGNGLSDLGELFVRVALRESATEKRILLDVKHLSLTARKQVYKLMREEFPDVPILATHMGVVGTSWEQPPIAAIRSSADHPKNQFVTYNRIGGFLRRVPPDSSGSMLTRIPFNPWSINLYDEDIIQIMRSGGLIGVSLDRRILGATLTGGPVEDERFSRDDIPPTWQVSQGDPLSFYPSIALPTLFSGNQGKAVQDLWSFCQSIVHLVLLTELAKGNQNEDDRVPASINPWDHICLGSDFDGLISAVKTCPSADHFTHLFGPKLKEVLTAMINHLNAHPVTTTPLSVPVNVVEKLSFKNGLDFLKKHFV